MTVNPFLLYFLIRIKHVVTLVFFICCPNSNDKEAHIFSSFNTKLKTRTRKVIYISICRVIGAYQIGLEMKGEANNEVVVIYLGCRH